MSPSLYSKTPSVAVLDNRGLTVRDIIWHRLLLFTYRAF